MSPLSALAMVPAGLTLGLQGAWALPLAGPAAAMGAGIDPSQLCRAAIAATERTTRIPDQFLSAIGRVESGRMGGGRLNPWPWTVNAAGAGHFYPTKQAAEEAVRQFEASGVKSLDVGCLQVNLFYHPNAFPSLDQAFDPASNAAFAAGMLLDLFQAKGSWPRAAAAYHSMTPALGEAYRQKVLQAWSTPDRPASVDAPPPQDAMLDLTASGGAPRAGQPGERHRGPRQHPRQPIGQTRQVCLAPRHRHLRSVFRGGSCWPRVSRAPCQRDEAWPIIARCPCGSRCGRR